ncbi:XdhC family protein [Lacipirellula sp.]|uniref:XdhC family protein n=1 Tax=Lacipirellula sp. TaxID=2691419 RepID=UPI003D0EB934
MPSLHGYIERLAELAAAGAPFVSVTLVGVVGSTPSDVGSKMLVTAAGLDFGTIGGGRVEAKAIAEAQQFLRHDYPNSEPGGSSPRSSVTPSPQLVEWNLQRDVGMTCGGVVQLFFEIYNHGEWQIAIFGAGHVAAAVIAALLPLPCRIVCVDPRDEWLAKLFDHPRLRKRCLADPTAMLDDLTRDAFVLCMTMGHRTDRPILEAIFRQGLKFPYLGVIGSAAKRAVLRRELVAAGIPEEQADAFHCPIGLPLGSNLPAEIAISIVAQLLQVRDALKIQA